MMTTDLVAPVDRCGRRLSVPDPFTRASGRSGILETLGEHGEESCSVRDELGAFSWDRMSLRWGSYSTVILRCGLGLGFLSAVADRLGLWGAFGQPNVEWGNFSRFLEYTHTLNWFVPAEMIPPLGVIATGAETLFGLLLLVGWHTRITALLTGLLLLTFGVAMTLALGVKAPLNFAVFTGVGGALLLANCKRFPFSVDELLFRRTHLEENR